VIRLPPTGAQRKPPKYGNHKVHGLTDGFPHDSEKEMLHREWLPAEKRAGRLAEGQRQVPFDLNAAGPNGERIKLKHYYKVDFLVTYLDSRQEVQEVKGYMNVKDPATRLCRCKWQLIEANNPGVTVHVIS
jgi:hypothetical protein